MPFAIAVKRTTEPRRDQPAVFVRGGRKARAVKWLRDNSFESNSGMQNLLIIVADVTNVRLDSTCECRRKSVINVPAGSLSVDRSRCTLHNASLGKYALMIFVAVLQKGLQVFYVYDRIYLCTLHGLTFRIVYSDTCLMRGDIAVWIGHRKQLDEALPRTFRIPQSNTNKVISEHASTWNTRLTEHQATSDRPGYTASLPPSASPILPASSSSPPTP